MLGGTTWTWWFSNINHKGVYLKIKFTNIYFYCFVIILQWVHPNVVISHCRTKMPNPSPSSGHPQGEDTRPNEARSDNIRGGRNTHRHNHNCCQGVSCSSYKGKQAKIKGHVYDVGGIRGGNDLFDKTTHEIADFVSCTIKGGGEFQMAMDPDDLGFQPPIEPPLPNDDADELEVEQWKLWIRCIDERRAVRDEVM